MPQKRNTSGLRPWKPGQSGNPGGRPKNSIREAVRHYAGEDFKGVPMADAIAIRGLSLAVAGVPEMIRWAAEQIDGKLAQPVDQKHDGEVIVRVIRGDRA